MTSRRPEPATAAEILRGTMRLLLDLDLTSLPEFTLATGRRVDLMALGRDGRLVAIEVKSCRADFLTDRKWPDYLGYADQFYFAVAPGLPARAAAARGGADRGRPLRREPDPAGRSPRRWRRAAGARCCCASRARPPCGCRARPTRTRRPSPPEPQRSPALGQPLLDQEAGDAVRRWAAAPAGAPRPRARRGRASARPRSRRGRASAPCSRRVARKPSISDCGNGQGCEAR